MSTYLDDQALQSLLVLWRILVEVLLQLVDCKHFEIVNTASSLGHLLEACLVVGARHHLSVLDLLAARLFLELFVQLDELVLVDALSFVLTISLAKDLNLKRLFVSVLAHHSFKLESVSVQLHVIFLDLFFI